MESKNSELDDGENMEDHWYNESDTEDSIPDPNLENQPLFQRVNMLPVPLQNEHFEEGLVYFMSLKKQRNAPMLVMIIATEENTFVYRVFYVRGSSRATFHQAGRDKTNKYDEIWRLAPREELVVAQKVSDIFLGQTLRYTYGVNEKWETVVVTRQTSTTINGILVCGENRGESKILEKAEIVEAQGIFGSSLLHDVLQKVKTLEWTDANRSKTRDLPRRQPKLNPKFMVPADEKYKRKWHVMKILGKGEKLLC